MVLFNLNLQLENNYTLMLNEIIKIITILLVIQFMICWSYPNSKLLDDLSKGFLNDSCLSILIYVVLGIMTYHLVVKNIIIIY